MTTTKSTIEFIKAILKEESLSGIVFEKINDEHYPPNLRCFLNGKNLQLYIEEGYVFSIEIDEDDQPQYDNAVGTVDELMLLPEFESFNKCIHCGGDGFVESGPECDMPASMCCGGCTKNVECECEHEFQLLNF